MSGNKKRQNIGMRYGEVTVYSVGQSCLYLDTTENPITVTDCPPSYIYWILLTSLHPRQRKIIYLRGSTAQDELIRHIKYIKIVRVIKPKAFRADDNKYTTTWGRCCKISHTNSFNNWCPSSSVCTRNWIKLQAVNTIDLKKIIKWQI